ncbi:hypothetical protein F6X53_13535 [Methylobacterium soli]|uniref:Uncharacterized protein n=1 Tax=Methylobacterium soli TaxID=553447 RepID=A0A6L3SZC5_9HYPH|nr:hypothetical protein F6X53_13535 [Methylobacterium soli]
MARSQASFRPRGAASAKVERGAGSGPEFARADEDLDRPGQDRPGFSSCERGFSILTRGVRTRLASANGSRSASARSPEETFGRARAPSRLRPEDRSRLRGTPSDRIEPRCSARGGWQGGGGRRPRRRREGGLHGL